MKDWIFLIRQGHVWGHIEDTFKPSNFFLFRHFYSFEHILTVEYLIFIHTINITKNQMILVMSCFVVLKRRNWFELRIYSGSDWAQCVPPGRGTHLGKDISWLGLWNFVMSWMEIVLSLSINLHLPKFEVLWRRREFAVRTCHEK